MIGEERELLARALNNWDHPASDKFSEIFEEIRAYLDKPWRDEIYAQYDVHGNQTDDPTKVVSLLYVRKII